MKGAAMRSEFTIARVHGRVEVPQSLVIADEDYVKLHANTEYLDFISRSLEFRRIVFVGFSFLDPAILSVLKTYRDSFSPNYPTKHFALVGSDASPELINQLRLVDIEPVVYASEDSHHALWAGFRKHYELKGREHPELGIPAVDQAFQAAEKTDLHRFLAFTFAQTKLPSGRGESLIALVQESVVMNAVAGEKSIGVQKVTIVEQVRVHLRLTLDESQIVVEGALARLSASGQIVITENGFISVVGRLANPSSKILKELSTEIVTRLKIVYDTALTIEEVDCMGEVLEKVFLARAWDLGAAYAGAEIRPADDQVVKICDRLVFDAFKERNASEAKKISEGITDLFLNPPANQLGNLAELGRAALAVQLVLSSPRSTIFHSEVLPDILYFDSNIVLPAIVKGHPMQKGYKDAVLRLVGANKSAGATTIRRVSRDFLNEIVSHKRKSLEIVTELGLNSQNRLSSYVRYRGASNSNVYISGYANTLFEREEKYTFQQYLAEFAPYGTEDELALFLQKTMGFEVVEPKFKSNRHPEFSLVFDSLRRGYQGESRYPKDIRLVTHEAEQICALIADQKNGRKPVFVSADATLRRVIGRSEKLSDLSGAILSDIGFIGMVDLLVGLRPDPEVFTRLIWGMHNGDAKQQIRNLLISETIADYNEGMLIQMPELLKEVIASNDDDIRLLKGLDSKTTRGSKNEYEIVDRIRTSYLKAYEDRVMELRKDLGGGAVPN